MTDPIPHAGQNRPAAQACIKCMGGVPDVVAFCARAHLKLHEARPGTKQHSSLTSLSEYLLARLLRSDTFKARLVKALETYFPERTEEPERIDFKALRAPYSAFDFAVLLTILGMYRGAHRCCPEEEWEKIRLSFFSYVDLGFFLGKYIPAIGIARGLLVGGMRWLAYAGFAAMPGKGLRTYRKEVRAAGIPYDLALEEKYFGCNHGHVAAELMINFGFHRNCAHLFELGLEPIRIVKKYPEAVPFKVANLWLDALMLKGEAPSETLGDSYQMENRAMEEFLKLYDDVKESRGLSHWLTRKKTDFKAELYPCLAEDPRAKPEPAKLKEKEEETLAYGALPEEIRRAFSEQEINDIRREVEELA